MLISVVSLLIGFTLLVWSADAFTDNGAKIARIFNISPLIIGLLIFGFGTSAPEMLVSGLAAYDGHPELSIGNAFGSNIFNIGLVLAVAAIIHPVIVEKNVLKKEWLFLFLSTLVIGFLLMDGFLSFVDGSILLILLLLFLYYVFNESKKDNNLENEVSEDINKDQSKGKTWLLLIISLVILVSSARLVVWGGTNLALAFGVSDLIIGLTVVALGTSLPELAVAISSALKKQHQMIIGNIIGSNLFNSLGVLAIPGLILPFQIPSEVMSRDYIYMLIFTLLILIFSLKLRINRFGGLILLTILASYLYQLVWI
ncbi:MAG: calcium/sodium antiporter [Candidatus Thioglobus sp.]|jgi:cation:H+ antiporter|nr:calcium/sodium antiporter [Candidatus Pseudothioglobus singularis]MDB4822153.1 calcium/sodium antiporter [Candidatus Pseudothioglobus singularis]MDG1167008.1 calcium/sodium antiporter [Candidatus Thioglobus sp.]|tara:strand:- start:329 stop:1267 length:939 start_codon:yes stop_codon:yes gene_type:complete